MFVSNSRTTQITGVEHWEHSGKQDIARPVCLGSIPIIAHNTEIVWLAVSEITNSGMDTAKLGLMSKK